MTANGDRTDINQQYGEITGTNGNDAGIEDTNFELFLKDHLMVYTNTPDGQPTTMSYKDYLTALEKAKKDGTEPPFVDGIHLEYSDMSNVQLSDGTTHDFSKNDVYQKENGKKPNDPLTNAHSTFFIQLDTLLTSNMPEEWTKPGNGPTMSVTKTSGDFEGQGTQIESPYSPTFVGGGNGYGTESDYSATVHFADITNKSKVSSLDTDHEVSPIDSYNTNGAMKSTSIEFSNTDLKKAIQTIEGQGYKLVSISRGNDTTGSFDDNEVITETDSSNYTTKVTSYGKYGDQYAVDANGVKHHDFTLNFVKTTQKKSASYEIDYVYENGSQKNTTNSAVKGTINFESTDGNTWTIKDHDGDSYDIADLQKVAAHYTKSNNITLKVEDKDGNDITNSTLASLQDQNTKFTVTPNSIPDKAKIVITVPYYTTEHADVRFVDDDDNGSESGILAYLKSKNIILSDETSDKKGYGLSADFTKETSPTKADSINFDSLSKIMSTLLDHGYTYKSVEGGATTNDGKTFTFPAFDDIEGSDQHFVIHLGHDTEPQTKTIDETIKYVDEDNNNSIITQAKQIALTFSRTADLVDDSKSTPWTFEGTFNEVDNPTFKNYQIDQDASKITEVLNYTKNNKETSEKYTLASTSTQSVGAVSFTSASVAKLPDGISHLVITVPYKRLENIHIHYIDEDNNGQEINNSTNSNVDNTKLFDGVTGKLAGTTNIDNGTSTSIDYLKGLGYIFDEDATNGKAPKHGTFDTAKNNFNETTGTKNTYNGKLTVDSSSDPDDQNYYVYLYHGTRDISQSKTLTEHITYIDEKTGKEIHSAYDSDKITFTRTGTHDNVTNTDSWGSWSNGILSSVDNPSINGYTIDPSKITEALDGTPSTIASTGADQIGSANFTSSIVDTLNDNANLNIVVPYTKNPQPTQPTKPKQPTNKKPGHKPGKPSKPGKPKNPKKPGYNDNFGPHGQDFQDGHNKNSWNENYTPHAQDGYYNSNSPVHAQGMSWNSTSGVNGTSANGSAAGSSASRNELPQTGESQNKLGLIGLAFASIAGFFGLAADRKRKHN